MLFSDIQAMIAFHFDDNFATSWKAILANQAQHEVVAFRDWSWKVNTSSAVALVAGQQAYQLTGTSPVVTDFGGMIDVSLELTSGGARRTIRPMDQQVFDDVTSHNRVNGSPMLWTVTGGTAQTTSATVLPGGNQQLLLSPIPIATAGNGVNVFLKYWRNLASVEMSSGTDKPIIPVAHHQIIVDFAVAKGFRMLGLTQQAEGFLKDANDRLDKMVSEDSLNQPPRGTDRLVPAAPPSLQAQGNISPQRLTLPTPVAA